MKRLMTAACVLMMGSALSYGSGFGLFVSQWSPDEGDDTIGGGAKLELGGEPVGVEFRGSYFQTDSDLGLEVDIIPLDIGLVVNIPLGSSPVAMTLNGGGTWYFMDSNVWEVDDELGWYAGGGVKISLNAGIALFAQAQYRSLEATAKDDDPDEVKENEIDFSAMTYTAGILFQF